ncbi:transposase [uncultured Phascolarctobacterium sp.]|uniref:transposase n=1 Tax=uncultured Phascolarctobacterium sp. TaxID=512296 RepID=UPI0025DADB79|nr:transposase [uncultured Phascolarctobacterium sp.]
MAKYSFEFKKKVVMAYLNGEGSFKYIAKKYGVRSDTDVRKWIANYRNFGDQGLFSSRQNATYSFEKKLSIVELYLSSEVSYQELAIREGILNPNLITSWVSRFRIAGPEALKPHKKGRKKILDNAINVQSTNAPSTGVSAEYIKQLEDELLKLRIENTFLKELRRLRLEDEAKMRERRASSAVSEESLD